MTFQQFQDIYGYAKREFRWFCGLVTAVSGALGAQAKLVPPWQGRVSLLCVGAGAAFLYMTTPFYRRDGVWGTWRGNGCPPSDNEVDR